MKTSSRIYCFAASFLFFLRVAAQDPSVRFERVSALHSLDGVGIYSIIQDGYSLGAFKNSSADSTSLQGIYVFRVVSLIGGSHHDEQFIPLSIP